MSNQSIDNKSTEIILDDKSEDELDELFKYITTENGILPIRHINSELQYKLFDKLINSDKSDKIIQNLIGLFYLRGYGCTKDENEAIKWFKKSMEQNFKCSYYNLGNLYVIKKDYKEAKELYKAIAYKDKKEPGHKESQYMLGYIYYKENNHDEAITWYGEAAFQGHVYAQFNAASLCYNAKDYKTAIDFYVMAAFQNHAKAYYMLAEMHYHGYGCKQNYKESYRLYKKAESIGCHLATIKIKEMLSDPLIVKYMYELVLFLDNIINGKK